MPQRFIGGDQQPLLRGILRALVIRKHFPQAVIFYGLHDGDVIGREKSGPIKWASHNGGWVSWCHEFPWTPRIPGSDQKNTDTLARKGFPSPAIRLEGEGAGALIGETRFEQIHFEGFRKEVSWAVKMGADYRQADALIAFIERMIGLLICEAVQAITNLLLENVGFEPIRIKSLRELLSGPLELERFADRLPSDWRWAHGEGLSGMPKAIYLPLEFACRGQFFATSIPYWGEVEEASRKIGVEVQPYLSINFTALPPPMDYAKIISPKEFPKLHENGQGVAWHAHWSTRPSLIFAYLTGTLRQVVETATIH